MKLKIGDRVATFFGNGIVIDSLLKEDINLYKVELEGNHKGKMPWFAEHELNIIEKLEKAGPQK